MFVSFILGLKLQFALFGYETVSLWFYKSNVKQFTNCFCNEYSFYKAMSWICDRTKLNSGQNFYLGWFPISFVS